MFTVGDFRLILFVWLMTGPSLLKLLNVVPCLLCMSIFLTFVCAHLCVPVCLHVGQQRLPVIREAPLLCMHPYFLIRAKLASKLLYVNTWVYPCVHDGVAIHLSCVHAHSV